MSLLQRTLVLVLCSPIFFQSTRLEESTTWLSKNLPILALYEVKYKTHDPALADRIHLREQVISADFDGCNCKLVSERISFSRLTRLNYTFSFADIGEVTVEILKVEPFDTPQAKITMLTKEPKIRISELSGPFPRGIYSNSSEKSYLEIIAQDKDAAERLGKALRETARLCQQYK